jgi:NADPH-dependent 2,4-dienoyl-CoA reductase/sulfur reductase-like enzyme
VTIAIIGAGPAGIRAAAALVAAGHRPLVLDEGFRWGGQIYRQPPPGFTRPARALYGFEAGKAAALHRTMEQLLPQLDYRPQTLVWNLAEGTLDCRGPDGADWAQPYEQVILATGATDRILPFPGWTLPGVFTLGGAQVALKFQGCRIGQRVVFLGTGPLLYLVAYQYMKAGATVAAVLDTAPFTAKLRASTGMLRQPATLTKGLFYMARLRVCGIPMHHGVRPVRAEGDERVAGLVWREGGMDCRVDCDALAFHFGLRSETQLADLAGCRFAFDPTNRAWLPVQDSAGRSSVPGIYLAGDGAGIGGADLAELAGERAALALCEDLGRPVDSARAAALDSRIASLHRFRRSLEAAFPFPHDMLREVDDELVLCRCEEITVGTARRCIAWDDAREVNRMKALTRIGMGRCQGRICGAAAAEFMAAELNCAIDQPGRLRGQAPVKPLPLP